VPPPLADDLVALHLAVGDHVAAACRVDGKRYVLVKLKRA
jgi:hypothetical protein